MPFFDFFWGERVEEKSGGVWLLLGSERWYGDRNGDGVVVGVLDVGVNVGVHVGEQVEQLVGN